VSWAVYRPHPVVPPLVGRYIGYEQNDVTLPVHRGLPSRHVTLIISLQQQVRVTSQATTVSARGLVGGLQTEPVLVTQGRTQCGIHLELHPLAVASEASTHPHGSRTIRSCPRASPPCNHRLRTV
jgi:hypothetical protein